MGMDSLAKTRAEVGGRLGISVFRKDGSSSFVRFCTAPMYSFDCRPGLLPSPTFVT